MEPGNHVKSDSSSEESDRQEQVNDDVGAKRSYECTYCKRGFTNAQALGGHMNIHRKDRAKAKQLTSGSSVSKKPNEYMNSKYFAPISSEPANYYVGMEAHMNYQVYFPPSASAPRSSEHLSPDQERLGANLTLRIGPTHTENREVRREDEEKDEVDLELRLGPDP